MLLSLYTVVFVIIACRNCYAIRQNACQKNLTAFEVVAVLLAFDSVVETVHYASLNLSDLMVPVPVMVRLQVFRYAYLLILGYDSIHMFL